MSLRRNAHLAIASAVVSRNLNCVLRVEHDTSQGPRANNDNAAAAKCICGGLEMPRAGMFRPLRWLEHNGDVN
jgi:hypothetical protein